ncbi:MAG: radical SAM protein [Burkholderiales bacterium]|nr:radical SAM protein [Burkholderiales bacterium]
MGITERIDAVTGLTETYSKPVVPAPRSVKIELTGRCNFNCSFCARSQRLRAQKDMDRALFERLLLEMRAAGVEEIGLFYLGESFLVDWLEDAVHFAKKVAGFPYVFLTTNGSVATPRRVQACARAGLDSLKFSLNYADEEQFRSIAQVKSSFYQKMLDNLRGARAERDLVEAETGHRMGLYASYIQYDGEQGVRMQAVVDEMRPFVDELYALPLYNQAALLTESEESRGWEVTAGNRGRLEALRDPLPCWSIFTEGHIAWDGKLSACCFDHDGRFHMGDLQEEGFMQAWNSPKFQALREAHLKKDVRGTVCEKCVAYA